MIDTQKRLLSIDGGGLRGMIAFRVLARIEAILRSQSGNPELVLSDYFDYIAGTSSGGIIATGLALGMSVKDAERFYRVEGPRLFAPTRNPIKKLFYARYDAKPLENMLRQAFGADTTLGSDRLKSLLLLVMLNAATNSPWPISSNPKAKYNDPAFGGENNLDLPLWQLVRATAAAPYYFEPEQIEVGKNRFLFYDGALTTMNNPAFKLFQMATLPCYRLEWPTGADRMLLVSVGTGLQPAEVTRQRLRDKQVGTIMVNAMNSLMHASMTEVDMQCRSFGRVLAGDQIDGEAGDFIGGTAIGGVPLFTYMRYNVSLTQQGLAELGCASLLAETAFGLDDIHALDASVRVGNAIADQRVRSADFAAFPAIDKRSVKPAPGAALQTA